MYWEENKMKKKALSIMMAAAMVASLAAGCGSSDSGSASGGSDSTGGASATESTAGGASGGDNTLTVWCWDPAFNIYAMEEAAKVYQQDHPDFVLNVVETPWEDVQTKLTTAATSNQLDTLPDILLMQDNAFQKNVISYPDAFVDLTDSGVDYSQFASGKVAYSTVDGKNYGVPFDNGAVIACYRTDILEEAGYTVDDFTDITWSEYLTMGKDILAKTGKPLLSCQAGESDVIMMMLQSAGASLFDADGNPDIVGNDTLKVVMETYAELKTSGVLIEVNDWDQYVGSITTETVAGTINGCWIMASIQTADDQSGKWAITNMPKLEGVSGATNYSNNGGSSWAVTAGCKNTDLAFDFLASTFAGSVEFYENILPSSGALATYAPAADSDVYNEPSEFFGGEAVFAEIVDFSTKTPSNNTGVYYYEARDAIATAITNVVAGADIDSELQAAQSTVEFAMGK
jgi:lactose/L-arabinose transport system substrate-binding protein